ncbi:hypothetical protein [Roseovarius sp. Pro17]|uniref:hypothetical protein n=1 Tax=Roseovarius sp. Pro17 TaxID=3108175 RepID=UPI002D786262|nr:hypothetical protein [Roseovarius sp. Pro17]
MKRFIVIAALCVPVAGLATTFDNTAESTQTFEIRVSEEQLAKCQQTLRELRQTPVVTDGGWTLPSFMKDDDLPRSVCVVEA